MLLLKVRFDDGLDDFDVHLFNSEASLRANWNRVFKVYADNYFYPGVDKLPQDFLDIVLSKLLDQHKINVFTGGKPRVYYNYDNRSRRDDNKFFSTKMDDWTLQIQVIELTPV